MSVEAYLKLFHPQAVDALSLCESLMASLSEAKRDGMKGAFCGTTQQVIKEGISKVC